MSRRITPATTLDDLKREAKRWLKALRANVAEARARFARAHPEAPATPTLRDVQHALAREQGLPGWTALKQYLASAGSRPAAGAVHDETSLDVLVTRFLDNACPDHHVRGAWDHARAQHTAMRLLARHPEIARASFATAVVCGDLAAVERALAERPELARERSSEPAPRREGVGGGGDLYVDIGPKGWEPLLFLCFTRLPLPAVSANAVAIARTLLDHGADPNAFFMAGDSRYTPLVGAVGEGEEDRPPHPQRDALVRLLLERGANPYDAQVVYDIGFSGNVLWFLELAYEAAVRSGRRADWEDPEWSMLDMGGYGSGARWHLRIAIEMNDVALARWCLEHGANPNAAPPRDERFPQRSLYEEAVRRGRHEITELLVRHGAVRTDVVPDEMQTFIAACLRMDRDAVQAQLAVHPEYLSAPDPLFAAAGENRADVVAFLLDLGMSPEVESETKERPLHVAASNDAVQVAELLIARGAEIDPVETNYQNTPLAAAVHFQHAAMIELLGRKSRDIWQLTFSGRVERLREVLREQPERARVSGDGETPLMWLPPDDEARAIQIAELHLAHGADPTVRNRHGQTAADRAERLGMFGAAELLRAAERRGASAGTAAGATLERYERMAVNLLDAFRTGTREAMERHWKDTWHQRAWKGMRRYVLADLGRPPETEGEHTDISMDDARFLVAREAGFESWSALAEYVASVPVGTRALAAKPIALFSGDSEDAAEDGERTRDWDAAIEMLSAGRFDGLDAHGQMTDDVLERISPIEHVTSLRLGASSALTDEGLRHLARMPQLRHLDLGGCSITDRGLAVLRELPALESVSLASTGVTDEGAAHLARCERIRRVDLSWTRTGDGAIRALAGMPALHDFRSGVEVSNAGLALLTELPVFRTWQGGEPTMALLSADAGPNYLSVRGPFTNAGLAQLAELEGLFALNIHERRLRVTAAGLAPLVSLPHLGWLAFDATDAAMPHIAAMPALRFLSCQDTSTSDDGFAALSRSPSIEYIWGGHCSRLRGRGFRALATMPSLRALSVSCKHVDDAALASLPGFPALRELMPIDVPDAGYRHIGRCAPLESLVLMYCRDTTDAATEQITELRHLTNYFASYTQITDRTPELLARIASLERIELHGCAGVTNGGIAALARLPRLRELRLAGMQRVTRAAVGGFPANVRVRFTP